MVGLFIVVSVSLIPVVLLALLILRHQSVARLPYYVRVDKNRRTSALITGVALAGYTAYGILAGSGVNIIAALLGTLGIALALYGLGRDDMLNTILGYFKRGK